MRLSKDRQTADAAITIGKVFRMEARADFSPPGLVAVGVLVCGVLLSSSVLVSVAGRARARRRRSKDDARVIPE